MIRVTRSEQPSRTILTVDGQLSGESVSIVETCCKQAESDGNPVEISLRDLTGVDEDGRVLLTKLAARGVRLTARGVYTSYLIETLACTSQERTETPGPHLRKSA